MGCVLTVCLVYPIKVITGWVHGVDGLKTLNPAVPRSSREGRRKEGKGGEER